MAIRTLKADRKHSTWSSFQVALKQVFSRGKLESITRLSKIQAQMAQHVLSDLRSDVSSLSHTLTRIERNNKQYQLQPEANLVSLRGDISGVLERFDDENGQTKMQKYARSNNGNSNPETEDGGLEAQVSIDTELLHNTLSSLEKAARQNDLQLTTCNWIFEKLPTSRDGGAPASEHVDFVGWLRSQESTFWIAGKPGSGKSALLKFIAFHEKVEEHLKVWAGESPLLIARFFFWNAGSDGSTNKWALDHFQECPNLEYLYNMYDFIIERAQPAKICLFIDGLDEFQELNQPLYQLLACLRKLKASPHVKMCVSSRPWPEFEDEFGKQASLKVEDLTRRDIRQYVLDKFNDHPQFPKLVQMDAPYSSFIDTIASHAEGVFLWVYLVVREILQGLTFSDSLATLRSRLLAFPPDLNSFSRHILATIPEAYRKQTGRYFKIALECEDKLPLLVYSFLDDLECDYSYASNLKFTNEDMQSREARISVARRRLYGRSRGLLECQENPYLLEPVVSFLHRTVRDYLVDSIETRETLWSPIGSDDDTGLLVCHAILAYVKTAKLSFVRTHHVEIYDPTEIYRRFIFEVLFEFGESYSQTDPGRQKALYTVLSHTEKAFLETRVFGTIVRSSGYESGPLHPATCLSLLLGTAACFGMDWYIVSRLSEIKPSSMRRKLLRQQTSISPLYVTLLGRVSYCWRSAECIRLLLEAGADPNATSRGSSSTASGTVWIDFLSMILRDTLDTLDTDSEYRQYTIAVIKLFLAYGACANKRARNYLEAYLGVEESQRLVREARFRRLVSGSMDGARTAFKALLK
ncbi:hypothetical protein V8F06_008179 [Rhypophila decipiens]